jgi:hypothetical protein
MAKKFQLPAHKVERNSHSGFVRVEPFSSDCPLTDPPCADHNPAGGRKFEAQRARFVLLPPRPLGWARTERVGSVRLPARCDPSPNCLDVNAVPDGDLLTLGRGGRYAPICSCM